MSEDSWPNFGFGLWGNFHTSQTAMEHRRMLNTPQVPDTDCDPGWNHTNQLIKPMATAGAFESSSLVHPVENMPIRGGPIPSSAPRSSGYSPPILNAESTHFQPETRDPSHDSFLHQPPDINSHMVLDNNLHHSSSSSLSWQTVNQTMGRVSHKRKNPCVPQLWEKGSTSRYYDFGSSSNLHLPDDPFHGTLNTEPYHTPLKYHRVKSLSISGGSVRSKAGGDVEHNQVRAHFSSNFSHHPFSSRSSEQTTSSDFSTRSSNILTTERNHGVTVGPGSSFFSHDPNTLNLNSQSIGSVENVGSSNNTTSNRNTVARNANRVVEQSIRGIQSGYDQISVPTFRVSTSNFQAGQVTASNEGLRIAAESNPSRPRQVFSAITLCNSGRSGVTGITSGRSLSEEGLTAVDRSALYGSRNPVDQHRDMRLDVDNMSYEELLVLGERIGSVSTGLSDNLISKCLTESIFCASDQFEDDGRCVICLEEYKHMDDVGNLRCGHDFHVGCIRKWLSMKKLCPICKASAMDESNKGK